MLRRGQVWWVDLGVPRGSSPGYKRPVVVIQADLFNKTEVGSVIVAIATTTKRLGSMPGNVSVSRGVGGLREDSVINVTQLYTVDRIDLLEFIGTLPKAIMDQVDNGLRLVLSLRSRGNS